MTTGRRDDVDDRGAGNASAERARSRGVDPEGRPSDRLCIEVPLVGVSGARLAPAKPGRVDEAQDLVDFPRTHRNLTGQARLCWPRKADCGDGGEGSNALGERTSVPIHGRNHLRSDSGRQYRNGVTYLLRIIQPEV